MPLVLILLWCLCCAFTAGVEMEQVSGVLGSSIVLDFGLNTNLGSSEIVCEFTDTSGTQITIVDFITSDKETYIHEFYQDRLHFNQSTGKLVLNNVQSSDEGKYTISVDGAEWRHVHLQTIDLSAGDIALVAESIIALVSSSTCLIVFVSLWCQEMKSGEDLPRHRCWMLGLSICNVVSFVAIFITLSHWIGIKGADPLPVIALCLVSLLLLTLIPSFAGLVFDCQRINRFQTRTGFLDWIKFVLHVPLVIVSIIFFKEKILQNNGGSELLTSGVLLVSKVEWAIIFSVSLLTYCCRSKGISEEQGQQGEGVWHACLHRSGL